MGRRECHALLHMDKHLAHMRERVVLRVARHRVVLALCNLSHIVALLDLSFSFRHFYLRLFSPRVAEWHKKRPSSESICLRNQAPSVPLRDGKPFGAES